MNVAPNVDSRARDVALGSGPPDAKDARPAAQPRIATLIIVDVLED